MSSARDAIIRRRHVVRTAASSGRRTVLLAGLLVAALATLARSSGATEVPTWSGDVRPILESRCIWCHRPEGSAPREVDLSVYGSDEKPGAARWARAIAEAVLAGTMPPWLPDPRFDDLLVPPRLTPEEVAVLTDWARAGAPEGEAVATKPRGKPAAARWAPTGPDLLSLETTAGEGCEPLEAGRRERHRMELELQQGRWITGMEVLPADRRAARRIVVYLEPPPGGGQELTLVDQDTGEVRARAVSPGLRFLGQWLPGDHPMLFPDTAGLFAPVGSRIVADVLLRPGGGGACATSGLRLALQLDRPRQEIDLWLEGREVIAGGRAGPRRRMARAELRGDFELEEDVRLIALYPQISGDLASYEVTLEYADGRHRILLLVPDYRPALDSSYPLAEPLVIPAGTRVEIRGREVDATASSRPPARFAVALQYVLADHLIVEAPDLPPDLLVELGYGKAAAALGAPAPLDSKSRAFVPPAAQLFRAENGYHLVEGSIPAPGVFRLRVHDSGAQLLDPRNFAGEVVFEYRDEPSETFVESHVRLRPHEQSLWARVPRRLPVAFHLMLWLAGEEGRFDFEFEEPRSGPVVRRQEPQPIVVPPALDVAAGDDGARRDLLGLLDRRRRELESAAASGRREDVARAASELWRIGMAASRAVSGLGPNERSRLQLAAGELARAALAVLRVARDDADESARLHASRERLDHAVVAALSILGGE